MSLPEANFFTLRRLDLPISNIVVGPRLAQVGFHHRTG